MRKIEKIINVYNFDELSESAKEKALTDRMEIEKNDYCELYLEEDMQEKTKELLDKYFKGAIFNNVYYSLSYCQGDGAMIEFSIGIEDFNKYYHAFNDKEMRFLLENNIIEKIEVKHVGRYYHKYAFDINISYNNSYWEYGYDDVKDDYNISKNDFDNMDEKLCKATSRDSAFYNDIVAMNSELENFGYSSINYYNTEDSVLSLVKEDEYLEDGSVYYE